MVSYKVVILTTLGKCESTEEGVTWPRLMVAVTIVTQLATPLLLASLLTASKFIFLL